MRPAEYLLGTIGSLAPFHSHKQNMATTTNPEHRGARTIGEFHGNVTPPLYNQSIINYFESTVVHVVLTQIKGNIKRAQPPRVRAQPR